MSDDAPASSEPKPGAAEAGEAAAPTPSQPAAPVHDEYLTSGARFVRWNLVSLLIALAAIGAGALYIKFGAAS